MKNPRYINELSGIILDYDDSGSRYADPGSELHAQAVSGLFGTVAPYVPEPEPSPAPMTVSRAQGKAALIGASLWPQVLAYVDAIEDPAQQALARVALDDTTEWRRDSPFLTTAAAALGLSGEDLDGLFVAAAEIVL